MTYNRLALSTLLRSTGKTAVQIAALMAPLQPAHVLRPASSQKVDSWMRGKSLPRDEVRAWLADALNIPRATLYAACAGESDALSCEDGVRAAREEVDAARRWWASHVGLSEGEEANRDRTVAEALAVVVAQIDLLGVEPEPVPSPDILASASTERIHRDVGRGRAVAVVRVGRRGDG